MTLPSFFIIGAPKSGTGTLESWLSGHPDVFLPEAGYSSFHASDIRDRLEDPEIYAQMFRGARASAVGEVSCWYLYSDRAVKNILEQAPDARFIVCLRDPAEIAWALHSDNLANRIEHVKNFDTAWALSFARRQNRGVRLGDDPKLMDYASVCALGAQVARLLTMVPRDRVHFVFLEDLRKEPARAWGDLQDFLGVARVARSDFPIEDFVIERPLVSLHEIMIRLQMIKRRLLPGFATGLRIGTRINGLNRKPGTLKPVPREMKQKISDRLSEDIATLSVLTDRDLMHWLA